MAVSFQTLRLISEMALTKLEADLMEIACLNRFHHFKFQGPHCAMSSVNPW